jgi:hypothetical protein
MAGTVSDASGQLALKSVTDAITAENTDVVIPMDLYANVQVSGTWTPSRTGTAAYRLRRTAAAAVEVLALRTFPRQRTTASKGFKVTGAKITYAVSTADINDLTVSGAFQVVPATGAAPAAATSLGTVTYDAAHDTTGERKAQGNHTMTITFGTPAYLSDAAVVELLATCDGTATGVLDILQVELLGAETIVDAA